MDLTIKNIFEKSLVLPFLAVPLILMAALTCRAESEVDQQEANALAAIEQDNMTFLRKLPKYKASVFVGRAQNFSASNLDLQTIVHLQAPVAAMNSQDWTMNLATNGNNHNQGAVVWPIVGVIKTKIDGQFQIDGQKAAFTPNERIYYFEETNLSHEARLERAKDLVKDLKYRDYASNVGKIYAVITVLNLQELHMTFYELKGNSSSLVRGGVFAGGVLRTW